MLTLTKRVCCSARTRCLSSAASIFGQTFWRRGIWRLSQAPDLGEGAIDRWLRLLHDSEVIEAHAPSRFPGDDEYRFRSAAMRDAAYSLLTDEDRQFDTAWPDCFIAGEREKTQRCSARTTLQLVAYLEHKRSFRWPWSRLMMLTGIPLRRLTALPPTIHGCCDGSAPVFRPAARRRATRHPPPVCRSPARPEGAALQTLTDPPKFFSTGHWVGRGVLRFWRARKQ